ncbi:tenomodulin, partial [Silurus meridionalis]
VELGKKKNAGYCSYHCVALILGLFFLMLALCVFSLRYIWSANPEKAEVIRTNTQSKVSEKADRRHGAKPEKNPGRSKTEPETKHEGQKSLKRERPKGAWQVLSRPLSLKLPAPTDGTARSRKKNPEDPKPNPKPKTRIYNYEYKALLDGVETESMMEINSAKQLEIFRVGNGSEEVMEVHDFQNGLMGIRFAKHQRCYMRTQTRELPKLTEVDLKSEFKGGEPGEVNMQVVDSYVWIPAKQPINNREFLQNSKIWEICQELPIHWMHLSPYREYNSSECPHDILVSEIGLQLDSSLEEQGYCCQDCRRGYRYCRRYYEPLGGYWPYPYFYRGGRAICQIVMPCNWWIARMLGRV